MISLYLKSVLPMHLCSSLLRLPPQLPPKIYSILVMKLSLAFYSFFGVAAVVAISKGCTPSFPNGRCCTLGFDITTPLGCDTPFDRKPPLHFLLSGSLANPPATTKFPINRPKINARGTIGQSVVATLWVSSPHFVEQHF